MSHVESPANTLRCRLCGQANVRALFSEERLGRSYTSYHCVHCDLFQTLGEIDAVSPDYVELQAQDMDSAHRFLQTEHKRPAFEQWRAMVERASGCPVAGRAVLDIGCGVGGFLDYAASIGMYTYGFDASGAHVEEARQQHPRVGNAVSLTDYARQLQSDIDASFVTMWDVFEHIREPQSLLAEVRRLLARNDGWLYLSVPSGAVNPVKVRLARLRGREIGLIPWEHVFYYTPRSLRTMLTNAGFEVAAIGGVEPYVRKPLSNHERVRRLVHHAMKRTPYALQLYALARASR